MKRTQDATPVAPLTTSGDSKVYLPLVQSDGGTATPTPTVTPGPSPTPGLSPTPTPSPTPSGPPTKAEAVRFLAQASWGAAPEDIDPLIASGYAAWIDAQKTQAMSLTKPWLDTIATEVDKGYVDPTTLPYLRAGNAANMNLKYRPALNIGTAWMRNIIFGKDQLRQRVAWALSQIMVVSFGNLNDLNHNGVAMADYYDTLARNALGNFRDLLLAVTVHPAMSYFLSSIGNDKPDPPNNRYPDENYAREVMQLFTIGLWELNDDGTQKLDGQNNPIPTYDNKDIENMARAFTGLWFEGKPWPAIAPNIPYQWFSDYKLAMVEAHHDTDAKMLFHDKPWQTVLPADKTGMQDIGAALDALFNHPNIGPFIGRSLIKFLVTSNPSPAYVKRVAAVFANNGAGVRGDLFAVVKAILLDVEARSSAALTNPKFGKLQEPLVRVARMVRAFGAGKTLTNTDVTGLEWWGTDKANALAQWPLLAPSVFNFFAPGYRHLGVLAQNGLTSPEFQIFNSVTAATVSNKFAEFIDKLLHARTLGNTPQFKFDFTAERALAATPDALIDRLNLLLCAGQMSAGTRQRIVTGVNGLAVTATDDRVHLAVWLAAVCPEGAVLR